MTREHDSVAQPIREATIEQSLRRYFVDRMGFVDDGEQGVCASYGGNWIPFSTPEMAAYVALAQSPDLPAGDGELKRRAKSAVETLANTRMDLTLAQWGKLSRDILAAVDRPTPTAGDMREAIIAAVEALPVRTLVLDIEKEEYGPQSVEMPLELRDSILALVRPSTGRTEAIEAAARYVLDNSRRGNASLNDEQFDADTAKLMTAYRDIIGKAIASGHLALVRPSTGGLNEAIELLREGKKWMATGERAEWNGKVQSFLATMTLRLSTSEAGLRSALEEAASDVIAAFEGSEVGPHRRDALNALSAALSKNGGGM